MNSDFELKCAFCGNINEFEKQELYKTDPDGKECFREKFCINCGNPLTLKCPSCQNLFILENNFKKNKSFKLLETYWKPIVSELDSIIPKIKTDLQNYQNAAQKLTPEQFKLSQKEFLSLLPKVKVLLSDLELSVDSAESNSLIHSELDKNHKRIKKNITKIFEEIQDINNNIEANQGIVNEKKEKQLRKQGPWLDIIQDVLEYQSAAGEIRNNEKDREINALKPGYEKIDSNIQYDPSFYKSICPVCNSQIYSINHQIYIKPTSGNQLQFISEIAHLSTTSKSSDSINPKFKVRVYIDKNQKFTFHGQMSLLIKPDQTISIGREQIRDLDFNEMEAEEILFDENDPLARISRIHFSLVNQGQTVVLKAKQYDPQRIGTYLNSIQDDVRVSYPEGIELNSGDIIIVPLTGEENNPNKIEFELI